MACERAGEEERGRKEASWEPQGEPGAAGGAPPPPRQVLEGPGAQGPIRGAQALPSAALPEARLKAGEEADNGWPGGELAGPGRQPARPGARADAGGSARGCPGRRGWQSSPRHAQTVKAGQGEVGGGSLGFYLRCNSLVEDRA